MNIIKCPYCILSGMKKNLAEILPNGDLKVLRMISNRLDETGEILDQTIDSTIIRTNEFELICGQCNNVVVYKQPLLITPQVNILNAWGTMQLYYAKGSN